VAVEPVVCVPWVRERVVAAEVVAGSEVKVVHQVRVGVVDAVVHYGRCDILSGEAHGPGLLDVQVKTRLAACLAGIAQVPLVLEIGVVGRLVAGELFGQVLH